MFGHKINFLNRFLLPGLLFFVLLPEAKSEISPTIDSQPANIESITKDSKKAGSPAEQEIVADAQTTPSLPQAESIDLEQPVPIESPETEIPTAVVAPDMGSDEASGNLTENESSPKPLILLGTKVPASTSTRLSWSPSQTVEGILSPTPVLVLHGAKAGPTLCLTAAVHGDELNGIEIVRRVLYHLDVKKLSGTIIGVPIVNLQGFHRASRYLTDRRDLNRYFPGNPKGSSASRIAHSFFNRIISHCDALVDLHTGSFNRTNLPQLRADLSNTGVVNLTHGFGATVVLHNEGAKGTLRRAATDAGIPAVTLETGAPMQLQEDAVSHGVKGIQTLLNKLGMVKKVSLWGDPEPVYYQSVWVRADQAGILFSQVSLGQRVKAAQLLGTVTDPITNIRQEIRSPHKGRVLGMAINQVVQPGFAAYRIGIQTSEQEIPKEAPVDRQPLDDPDLAESKQENDPDRDSLEDS